MSIKYKGKLIDNNQLKEADVKEYTKMKLSIIDYLFTIIILIVPIVCGFRLLTSRYSGEIINVLVVDFIGLTIAMGLIAIHEYLHAITFSKKSDVTIWYKGFTMMTYCIDEKNAMGMIYTLLLPNLIITFPIMILTVGLHILASTSFLIKGFGVLSLIIILGSFSDLAKAFCIFRNRKNICKIRVSGDAIWYK